MRQKIVLSFIPGTETKTRLKLSLQKLCSKILLATSKQNNRHTTPPQTHIALILPGPKGIGSRHKSGTGNNRGRQQTTTRDYQCFNFKDSNSKSNDFSSPVIPVLPTLNDSVINTPQPSLVCQQSSSSSQNTTPDSKDYSIPGGTSADLSNTMPPPSTNNGSRNMYG